MSNALLGVYNRAPVTVDRGEGAWLYDTEGNAFLDCVCGIATNALGHAHPVLVEALGKQAQKLWHTSNIFRIPGQEELAEKLTSASFADVAYFSNSGSESVEAALKMARRYHYVNGQEERIDVIGFAGSFHGRTYAAINAAGNPSYVEGFGPRLPGYLQLTIDDEAGIAEALARPTTAALIVEPVQGEGGARALTGEWLKRVRKLCTEHGVLLIYDEVQSGMGRTGQLFAHQWFEGVEPDIMCIAKALGCGFPVGATVATKEAAKGMVFGVHGSTFGGNPLAMAVAQAAFDEIAKEETLAHARAISEDFFTRLSELAGNNPDIIQEIRGKGLLIGLKMVPNNREFMAIARDRKLLVAGGGDNCVRLLPPLNMSHAEVEEVVKRLEAACADARAKIEQAAA